MGSLDKALGKPMPDEFGEAPAREIEPKRRFTVRDVRPTLPGSKSQEFLR